MNIAPNVWKLYTSKSNLRRQPQPLACHGATILALSKVILMGGIEFVLKHFRPDKAHLLYLDTDSLHIALSEPVFEDNVAKHMKPSFESKKYYFLDEESAPSGMFVTESIVDYEQIIAEKLYVLKMKCESKPGEYVFDDTKKCLACKGIPHRILNKHRDELEDLDPSFGYQESAICRMGANLGVSNSVRYKTLGGLMVPSRRFFFDDGNSIPFTFPECAKEQPINETKDYRHYLFMNVNKKKKKKSADKEFNGSKGQCNTLSKVKKNKNTTGQDLPTFRKRKMTTKEQVIIDRPPIPTMELNAF